MRRLLSFLLLALIFTSASCKRYKEYKEIQDLKVFSAHYLRAEQDYCSTNPLVAEQGMLAFLVWFSDTKHTGEPVLSRDMVLSKVNGRLFLLEEHLGKSAQADECYRESAEAWNRYVAYLETLDLPPSDHPLERVASPEELRDLLARQDKGLEVGWMNVAEETSK